MTSAIAHEAAWLGCLAEADACAQKLLYLHLSHTVKSVMMVGGVEVTICSKMTLR